MLTLFSLFFSSNHETVVVRICVKIKAIVFVYNFNCTIAAKFRHSEVFRLDVLQIDYTLILLLFACRNGTSTLRSTG